MRHIELIRAEERDCGLLALLNRALIIAEHSDNTMSYGALLERMRTFLAGDYAAWFFRLDGVVVGYALVDMKAQPQYLRHFCIVESLRGQGYGTAAFASLQEILGSNQLDVDVLLHNSLGAAFWTKLGFMPRYTRMRLPASVRDMHTDVGAQES